MCEFVCIRTSQRRERISCFHAFLLVDRLELQIRLVQLCDGKILLQRSDQIEPWESRRCSRARRGRGLNSDLEWKGKYCRSRAHKVNLAHTYITSIKVASRQSTVNPHQAKKRSNSERFITLLSVALRCAQAPGRNGHRVK
jgi:hypothetical protein